MVAIQYGTEEVDIGLDNADIILPQKADPNNHAIEKCVRALEAFADETVTYIVNDDNRPTRTEKILERVEIRPKDRIIIATGSHSRPSDRWIEKRIGKRENIIIHDAEDAQFTYFGTTSFDNEIYLNSDIENTKKLVVITSVEPHYFAGFTGGRKSFLPGIARYETIERNHHHALNENARTLNLKGNPVHEEMMEVCHFVQEKKDIFCVNMIQDAEGNLADIKYGDIEDSFYDACEVSRNLHSTTIKKQYDAVVTVAAPPLDMSLYQSQKAMEHAKPAVKDGGTLVLISACREGIGPSNFYDLLKSGPPDEVMGKIRTNYKLGWHKTTKMLEALQHYDVYAVTDLPNKLLDVVNITPWCFSDLDKIRGNILVMPNGGITVPSL